MIEQIACDIKDLVLSSGYIKTHWEYAEMIRNGDVTYPAQYVGGANYEQVFNQDVNGNSYLRGNGQISFSQIDQDKLTACGGKNFVRMSIPLRLVMIVPKDKLSDSAFSDNVLALDMIGMLSGSLSTTITGVRSIEYSVTGYDTDSLSIWKAEVTGQEYQMNFRYSYIAINFNAVLIVNPSCLTTVCYA